MNQKSLSIMKNQNWLDCGRNKKEELTNEKIENDKNNLQTIRLKYLARSFMETLKDNARIIIK